MPFTFSHPAIVLPIIRKHKKYLSATGLIAGSITPDFEAFVNLGDPKIYGHTWLGMFWFDLPIAIVLAILFHGLVRDPLLANLPLVLQRKFSRYATVKWVAHFSHHFAAVITSMLSGIASHLLWDGATHLNILEPNETNTSVMFNGTSLYILLQYGSSVTGIGIILYYISILPQKPVIGIGHYSKVYWPMMIVIMVVALLTEKYFASSASRFEHNWGDYCISSLLISLLLTSATITRLGKTGRIPKIG